MRWALDQRVLDKDSVNYKSPESLDMLQLPASDTEAHHKKFVWKFGLLMYLLIYKKLPFSFVEANTLNNRDSESLQIRQDTIKKFAQHITSRLELMKHQWNPQFDMINNCLRGALIRDYQRRTRYLDLCALFQDVFNFYQPTPVNEPATRQVRSAEPAVEDFLGDSSEDIDEPLRTRRSRRTTTSTAATSTRKVSPSRSRTTLHRKRRCLPPRSRRLRTHR